MYSISYLASINIDLILERISILKLSGKNNIDKNPVSWILILFWLSAHVIDLEYNEDWLFYIINKNIIHYWFSIAILW